MQTGAKTELYLYGYELESSNFVGILVYTFLIFWSIVIYPTVLDIAI